MKKHLFILGIVGLSFVLQIEQVVPLVLADIAAEWSISTIAAQMIYSVLIFTEMIASFCVGIVASKLSKKKIVMTFQVVTAAGGIFAFLFGRTLFMLYMASVIIGFAASIISTVSKSIITENFKGEECSKLFGLQIVVTALGSVISLLIGGFLANIHWRFAYLTFLLTLVSFVFSIFMFPEGPIEKVEKSAKVVVLNKYLIKTILITACYGIIFMTFSSNITFLINEINAGNVMMASYISSITMIVTFVAGVVFSKALKLCGKYIIPACTSITAVGILSTSLASNVFFVIVGAVLIGLGSGIFTPAIYIQVAENINPAIVTYSMGLINAAAALGMFLNPYIVTGLASMINNNVSTRFYIAGCICIILTVIVFIDKKKTADVFVQ